MSEVNLIQRVLGHKIQYNNRDTLNKIKFKIEYRKGIIEWHNLMQINLREKKNQRKIESYIKQLQNENDSNILSDGYNGSKHKDQKNQTKKKQSKKRDRKQKEKKSAKVKKLIQGEPIKKEKIISEVLGYELANQSDEIFDNDLLNRFIFELKMENQQILTLTPKQIDFMIINNREKICTFIENVEDYEHFLILSKIRVNESYLFTDYLGKKQISWKELKSRKRKSSLQNQEEEKKNTLELEQNKNSENELEKNQPLINNQEKEEQQYAENSLSQSSESDFEENNLSEPPIYMDKNDLINVAKKLFYNGPLYTKKNQQEEVYIFRDKYFQIYNQRDKSCDNLIDALNIYCEAYLFTDRNQLVDLFVDRKFKLQNQLLENNKMNGLSLINFGQIIFDPIRYCFLTPEQVGIVEKDQINFYLEKKRNMTPVLLIGQEKPYILQYYNSKRNQVCCAIVKKLHENWYLYDNRNTVPIKMLCEKQKVLDWIQDIELIEIYQMKMENDINNKEHLRKIKHWYEKILKTEIPKKVQQYIEKIKKQDSQK